MMKKTLSLFFFLLIILHAFAGNCFQDNDGAEKILMDYLEAKFQYDRVKTYDFFSSQDKEAVSLEEFNRPFIEIGPSLITRTIIKGKASFHVIETKIDGNHATIKAELTLPDWERISRNMITYMNENSFGLGKKIENGELKGKSNLYKYTFKEIYPGGNYPKTTRTKTYKLIKETNGWKIFKGFRKRKQ